MAARGRSTKSIRLTMAQALVKTCPVSTASKMASSAA